MDDVQRLVRREGVEEGARRGVHEGPAVPADPVQGGGEERDREALAPDHRVQRDLLGVERRLAREDPREGRLPRRPVRRVRLQREDPDVQRGPCGQAEGGDEAEALAVGPAEEAAEASPLAAAVVAGVRLGRDGEAAPSRPLAEESDRLQPLDPGIRVEPRVAREAREVPREERARDVRPEGAWLAVAPRERHVPAGYDDVDAARLELRALAREEADVEDAYRHAAGPVSLGERVEKAPEEAVVGVVRPGNDDEVFGHVRGGNCRERRRSRRGPGAHERTRPGRDRRIPPRAGPREGNPGTRGRAVSPDVAVVSYGAAGWLRNLLESLREPASLGHVGEVHVWENASPDESPAVLERYREILPSLRVHRSDSNLGHGPALDRLLSALDRRGPVLVLDADTEIVGPLGGLPDLGSSGDVFAGQVHPDPPRLYAYLCHLLLSREAYLTLPPFAPGGAPGLDFFSAVEERGLPWRRLAFRGLVRHYGQGSLRGLVRRGERAHPLHRFAADAAARDPGADRRAALETELGRRLAAFLAGEDVPPLGELGAGLAPPASPARLPRAARHLLPAALLSAPALAARACRLGLGLSPDDALELVRRVRAARPERVLEVGTRHGGGLFLASRAARPTATLVTVDLPDWELDDPGEESKRATTEALVLPGQKLVLERADPLAPTTADRAAQALGGGADVLLLDARRLAPDPGAAGWWAALLRPGGLLAVTGGAPSIRAGIAAALPRAFRAESPTRPGAAVLFVRA